MSSGDRRRTCKDSWNILKTDEAHALLAVGASCTVANELVREDTADTQEGHRGLGVFENGAMLGLEDIGDIRGVPFSRGGDVLVELGAERFVAEATGELNYVFVAALCVAFPLGCAQGFE